MASIAKEPNGRRRIQFTDAGGTRRTIRLGKVTAKEAESIRTRVELLLSALITGSPIDADTARWLASIGDDLHDRIARVGLVRARSATHATIGAVLDACFENLDVKPSTRVRYDQTRKLLIEHFGEDRPIRTIRPIDADTWRTWLIDRGYAPSKVSREVSMARMFFRQAIRWEMIPSNPFEGVRAGSQINRERMHYVDPETAARLIDACPSHDWRCIVALARWGGLRCPSEVLRVRWADVDWHRARLRVTSPKTEHHAGKGSRVIPLFPELREVLLRAFEAAEEGAAYVVAGYRDSTAANLRTHLLRIIDRAGLTPWPRLFNAMRASRATELAAEHPAAVCTAWLGHTAAIAEAHYHMVRDSDYDRAAATPTPVPGRGAKSGAQAAQNPTQHRAEANGNNPHVNSQPPHAGSFTQPGADCRKSLQNKKMSGAGLEPATIRV